MIRRHLRTIRRLFRAAAARFVREERGSVLVMTIVFALPLAMFLFVCYNTGVALTMRMRAQCVADAASYSASLWHARFLNYTALTRRQITANYATMALCTSYLSCLKMYHNIYDANDITVGFGGFGFQPGEDKGSLKYTLMATYQSFNAMQLFSDNENQNPLRIVRSACDVLSRMLSLSQTAVYLTTGLLTTEAVMKKVVREANRRNTANSGEEQYRLHELSLSSLILPTDLVEQKEIPLDQVEHYLDKFTKGEAFNALPLLGRGALGGGWGDEMFIMTVWYLSEGVDIQSDGSKMEAKEDINDWAGGYYVFKVIYVMGIPVPIGLPIVGEDAEEKYDVKNPFEKTKVYMIRDSVANADLEPSSLAIVEVVHDTVPWYPHIGLLPTELVADSKIRAYSRAKAYFRGPGEDIGGGTYQKPHTSYPFWGARLAPLTENSTIDGLVRVAGDSLTDQDICY